MLGCLINSARILFLRPAEPDEDELQVDDAAHVQPEHGYEDRATGDNIPKRKWKRKVYPASTVRRSARIRKAKKFHDDL